MRNDRLRFNAKNRLPTKAQKKELLRRDGWCCRTPGCPHKIWLHLHHLKSYAEGGETSPLNLCGLCSSCHANLHAGTLQIRIDDDGSLVFLDSEHRRLDRRTNLEFAGWLDWWHGWNGKEEDSHNAKLHHGALGSGRLSASGPISGLVAMQGPFRTRISRQRGILEQQNHAGAGMSRPCRLKAAPRLSFMTNIGRGADEPGAV